MRTCYEFFIVSLTHAPDRIVTKFVAAIYFISFLPVEQHNNLEHLALMEKCVGLFPPAMLVKAPRTPEFFNELTGECRGIVECDTENRRHIRRMKSLQVGFIVCGYCATDWRVLYIQ